MMGFAALNPSYSYYSYCGFERERVPHPRLAKGCPQQFSMLDE